MEKIIIEKLISNEFDLEKVDMHDLKSIDTTLYKITNETYHIKGIGNLMIMNMKSVFNLMTMKTIVITPQYKDLSLINIDTIDILNRYAGLIEMYESCIEKCDLKDLEKLNEKYKYLKDYKRKEKWYDKIRLNAGVSKLGNKKQIIDMCNEYLDVYLDILKHAKDCEYSLKQKSNSNYVDQLLEKGGPAIDNFRKIIGRDKCDTLVKKYMFNTIE